jgi:1-acyl-sn-glycerol-3-phosphate acyltransferase
LHNAFLLFRFNPKIKPVICFLKFWVRLALWTFCPKVNIVNNTYLNSKGPLLLVANHPNSFLDAVIIGAFYQRKIHFLARGDVFQNPIFEYLLHSMGMIPVFRAREGKEHLHRNSDTFQESVDIIKDGGAVLLFIEGICLNTHEIQPFKKGASRILENLHSLDIFPSVHVIGIAYNSFRGIGKSVHLKISDIENIKPIIKPSDRLIFNASVLQEMSKNIHVPVEKTHISHGLTYYFHLPYYRFIEYCVDLKFKHSVFFDSVLFAALLFTYPIYLALWAWLLWITKAPIYIAILLFLMPILAPKSIKLH